MNYNIYNKNKGIYVVLGNFDGLHIGHMSLINEAVKLSIENNCYCMLYSFKNHPLKLINKDIAPKLLMTNTNKVKTLQKKSVDIIKLVNFDETLMKTSPEDFILNLISEYNIEGIIVGFNYRFGYKNMGTIDLLEKMSTKYNFMLKVMPPCKVNNQIVSSTKIRNLISSGNLEEANIMLNRKYSLEGIVVHGRQIGRQMDFPTANLKYDKDFVIPAIGVYYTNVEYNEKLYRAITSVGNNPTVSGNYLTIETYILDFSGNLYDKHITLFFIKKIRDEKKFDSLDALKAQLNKAKNFAKTQPFNI